MTSRTIVSLAVSLALIACSIDTASAQRTVAVSSDIPAGTSCPTTRRRKAWEAYTTDEQALYVSAVADAISRGYQQKFVELHTEYFSEAEAHKTCVFIYWHRMFLLGYENMLRSLDAKYACLTLPVWDHLTLAAKRASGSCSSLQSCSPLLTKLGGTSTTKYASDKIYNVTIPYSTSSTSGASCVTLSPLSGFCGNTTRCANCIVRGTVPKTYPTAAQFASVYQQIFGSNLWSSFTSLVEQGVHNTVHSSLGGAMAYLQSPIDPIFYSHHALIDALQVIYLKCQNGVEGVLLTPSQKSSDGRFWSSCARRTEGTFAANDTITMRTRALNFTTWVDVRTSPDSTLYPFFKDLPGTYAEYVDAKDLGIYSYSYEISGALANMYVNCNNSNTISAATVNTTRTSLLGRQDDPLETGDASSEPFPTILPSTVTDVTMQHWAIAIYEAAKIVGYTDDAAREQMELVTCQHKEECLGGTDDYTELFRQNFMAEGHPRCYTLVQDLKAGDRVIGVPKWRTITARFLPCRYRKRLAVPNALE